VEKCGGVGQATGDSMVLAHSMVDNKGYTHTLRFCNTYCFSIATVFARTCLMLHYTYIVCLVFFLFLFYLCT
jgi:hypothetical protein